MATPKIPELSLYNPPSNKAKQLTARLVASNSLVLASSGARKSTAGRTVRVRPLKVQRAEIRKTNKKILERLTSIITKKERSSSIGLNTGYRKPLTLNGRMRKNELIRITKENKAFLRRLEGKRSCYNLRRAEVRTAEKTLLPSTARTLQRAKDPKLTHTAHGFEVSSALISQDCAMMSKCSISNKKLRKFGEDYYFVEAAISGGKLRISACNIRRKNFFAANYSFDQSMSGYNK